MKRAREFDYNNMTLLEEAYTLGEQIGNGKYGVVYVGIPKKQNPGQKVAIKAVLCPPDPNVSIDVMVAKKLEQLAAREVAALKMLSGHANVIQMYGVYTDIDCSVFISMELAATSLYELIKSGKIARQFSERAVKGYMQQIMRGIAYCHEKQIVHRDIKPQNILVMVGHVVKLADFGLAKQSHTTTVVGDMECTQEIVTLWYRPPELLVGHMIYNYSVDIWAAGCCLAELLLCRAFLPGKSEKDQLLQIWSKCGSPSPIEDGFEKRLAVHMSPYYRDPPTKRTIRGIFSQILPARFYSPPMVDLMDSIFALNPKKRPTAADILKHEFFKGSYTAEQMPIWPESAFKVVVKK